MPMAPRISALLFVAFLAPASAGAGTWSIEPRESPFFIPAGEVNWNKGTVSGALVYDEEHPATPRLTVTFHELFLHYPSGLQPPRQEIKLTVGEASFESREGKTEYGRMVLTGTFQAQGKTAPATYNVSLTDPVEDVLTGRTSREAIFVGDSREHPSFRATLVKPPEPEALPQQTAGEKTAGKGPWGVLVGLATPETLKTFFISASELTFLGNGLAVPRRDGWWFVDTAEGEVVMRPAGKVTKKDFKSPLEEDDNCADGMRGGYTVDLLYAGPAVVSYELNNWKESCSGPFHYDSRHLVTTGFSDHDGDIGSVLGPEAQAAYDAALKADCPSDGCSYNDRYLDRPSWGLTPLRVFAAFPDMNMSPTEEMGYRKEPLPAKLLAGLKRPSRHFVPDAQHPLPPLNPGAQEPGPALASVTAPDGSFELRFYADGIVVWAGGNQVGSIPEKNSRLVLEEWASGTATLARWKKQATATLANVPRPTP